MKHFALMCVLLLCSFAAIAEEKLTIDFSLQNRLLFPDDSNADATLQTKITTKSSWPSYSFGMLLGYLPDQATAYRFYGQTYKIQKYRYVGGFVNKEWKLRPHLKLQSAVAPMVIYGSYLHSNKGNIMEDNLQPTVNKRSGIFFGVDVASSLMLELNRQVFVETSLGLTPSTFRDFEGNFLGLMHMGIGLGIKI